MQWIKRARRVAQDTTTHRSPSVAFVQACAFSCGRAPRRCPPQWRRRTGSPRAPRSSPCPRPRTPRASSSSGPGSAPRNTLAGHGVRRTGPLKRSKLLCPWLAKGRRPSHELKIKHINIIPRTPENQGQVDLSNIDYQRTTRISLTNDQYHYCTGVLIS